MLNKLYTLPKALIAILVIGAAIFLIIASDPPHSLCDTQVEHFQTVQSGILYRNPKDFRKEKSALKRKKKLCEQENAPGACYDYFFYLRRVLKDLKLLSEECAPQIYNSATVKNAFREALILITALAWREKVLTGKVSKYNWLSRPDLFLFCELQRTYILNYGRESYTLLESQILQALPMEKKYAPDLIRRKTILTEPCSAYR